MLRFHRYSKVRLLGIALVLSVSLLFTETVSGQNPANWHYPLYLANLGYWHQRIAVDIYNPSGINYEGEPVAFRTGSNKGELDIAGLEAGSVRIVDREGIALLCRITSPGRELITEGVIPPGCEIILPVSVPAKASSTLYIYCDNPSAWPVGAVLEGAPATGKHRERAVVVPKPNNFIITVHQRETISLRENLRSRSWPEDKSLTARTPLKIFNFSPADTTRLPVYFKMDQVYNRLKFLGVNAGTLSFEDQDGKIQRSFSNALLIDYRADPLSDNTLYAYFSADSTQGSSVQQNTATGKRNLLKGSMTGPEGFYAGKDWSCTVPVTPGRIYMFGGTIHRRGMKTEAAFELVKNVGEGREGKWIAGTNKSDTTSEWTCVSGIFRAPEDVSLLELSLSTGTPGKVFISDLVVLEVLEGFAGSMYLEQREDEKEDILKMWPVLSVKKVFREDLPPSQPCLAAISAAGNETEPLQVAVRSQVKYGNVRIEVTAPVNGAGIRLDSISTWIEGYVPVDYPSSYYERKVPYWYLKFPDETPGSDGWAGYWPDPLLPAEPFTLEAGVTQPLWIEIRVPAGAPAGKYTGMIRLYSDDKEIGSLPWSVEVHSFTLPETTSFAALYDFRSPRGMPAPGPDHFRKDISPDSLRSQYLSFMAAHRICTGEIEPVPSVRYRDGKAEIDFTEYDKAATRYFEVLRNPVAYLPVSIFYLFGWAFPPSEKFGEKPYTGEYPYEDADRGKLRPGYRKAYQAVLKTFWDHLREKGWADHYVLYLADEPHSDEKGKADIVGQMRALCTMIHEVDASIPVYVSTWWYRPEWQGYIDIWGLGFNGDGDYGHGVTSADMETITGSGGKIWYTTDGNFCTETPYTALERLLPWFGFRYGAGAYEFWGVNWLTLDPYKYGWHNYIFESQAPGEESWKRYPNGDGYIIYPGKPAGYDGLIASIRLKQVREGAEDYEYFTLLEKLIKASDPGNPDLKAAREAMKRATDFINIPCPMGRYSTGILKSPDILPVIREQIAVSIEKLMKH